MLQALQLLLLRLLHYTNRVIFPSIELMNLLLFVIGTIFGSFTNVIIDRLPRGESFLKGRSHCESCKKEIKPYDLFPIISYLILFGKCRNCKKPISKRTIFMEVFCGLIFIVLYSVSFPNILLFAVLAVVSLTILAISVIDIDYGIIPDVLLGVLGVITLPYLIFAIPDVLVNHLITAVCSFIFFLIIFLATKGRGIGFGDVKYVFFIGLFLGGALTIVAFYAAFLTGALISIILVVLRKKKMKGSTIPFGPFLSLGMFLSIVYGNQVVQIVTPYIFP